MPSQIKTNHQYRNLKAGYELDEAIRSKYFDYLSHEEFLETSYRFFKYRNYWYDTNEFSVINYEGPFNQSPNDSILKNWDGIQTDSFFSGIVIKYETGSNFESIKVGTYFC